MDPMLQSTKRGKGDLKQAAVHSSLVKAHFLCSNGLLCLDCYFPGLCRFGYNNKKILLFLFFHIFHVDVDDRAIEVSIVLLWCALGVEGTIIS